MPRKRSLESAHPQEKFQISEKEIAAVASESEWREGGSSTGKMRRQRCYGSDGSKDDREEEEELVEDTAGSEPVRRR